MKKLLSSLLLLFLLLSLYANGEVYLETEHFKIIYGEESNNMATEIMNVAEEEYDRLVSFFNKDPNLHIPIYINSKEKSYNAYLSTYPSLHLVFYNTWIPQTLYNGEQTIRLIFRHELTHALMFYYKGLLGSITTTLFGDSADLSKHLHYLQFITEGMAVYLESFDKRGRLNNPLFDKLRIQAAIENININYLDASGSMDIYPGGNIPYILGGEFFKWVAEKYGEELLSVFILDIAENVFAFPQNAYKKHFNSSLYDDWNSFLGDTEVPKNLIEPNKITNKSRIYSDITAEYDEIYAISSYQSEILKLEDDNEKNLFKFISSSSSISVNNDNILLSFSSQDQCYTALYTQNGKELKRYNGYYEGSFIDDDIALLRFDDTKIYLDILNKKTFYLGQSVSASNLINLDNKATFLFEDENGQAIAIADDSIYLYRIPKEIKISSINSNNETISVSYTFNTDGELSKYGEIDIETNTIYLSNININGGINNPIKVGDYVYFISEFFNSSAISKISIEDLTFDKKYSLTKEKISNISSPETTLNTKKYNPIANIQRGTFIPFSKNFTTYIKPLVGPGLTWITSDPTEKLTFITSLGYSVQSQELFLSLNASYQDISGIFSLYNGWSESVISYTKDYPLKSNNNKITLSNSLYFITPNNIFINNFLLTYCDLAKRSNKRFDYSGYILSLELNNFSPTLSAGLYISGLFPTSIKVSHKIDSNSLSLYANTHIFTIEIQKSIPILLIYIKYLDFQTTIISNIKNNSIYNTYLLSLITSLSPVVGSATRADIKFGIEAKYTNKWMFSFIFNIFY